MKTLRGPAHAKVNLTLEVLGRRGDGYHEMRSVMARISLADEVRVRRAREWRSVIRPPLGVAGDAELSLRAARELARRAGRRDGVAVVIRKRVPEAAGLGGGSSDAATALRLLARLWRLEDAAALRASALAVGSDVPFFLDGALAEVRGRGEAVRPLRGGPWHGVLVLPHGRIATRDAFARLPERAWSRGERTAALVRALGSAAVDAAALRALCANAFDAIAPSLCPEIGTIRAAAPDVPLFLSGSGPSLFALCDDRARALALRRRLRRAGWRAHEILVAVPP